MGLIQNTLNKFEDFLVSIERDTQKGWFYIKVGIPVDWVFKGNTKIACETLKESEFGHLVKIAPKNSKITIDDLIEFASIIQETNEIIVQKQNEVDNIINSTKEELAKQVKEKLSELESLKENSFTSFDNLVKETEKRRSTAKKTTTNKTSSTPKPPPKKRGPKPKPKVEESETKETTG